MESATTWRTAILLESRKGQDPEVPGKKYYYGIRTSTSKYVEHEGGFRELYALGTDPYEKRNTYSSASSSSLQTRLQALKDCAKDSCRAAEDGR
jgi:hypothetical protein